MATKPNGGGVGKEKKTTTSSHSSQISSTTKRTPIKATTTSKEKSTTTSDKNGPNSVKSKGTQIPKLTVKPNNDPSSNSINSKPIRRSSFDKPIPSSEAQLKKQPSPSRQQLVSPGPRDRPISVKKSIGPVKSITNITTSKSRPITSSNVKEATKTSVGGGVKSGAKKSVSSTSITNTKKVVGSTKVAKSSSSTKKDGEDIFLEKLDKVGNNEEEVKEAINEEKEENDHDLVLDHDNYHHHKVEEYDDQVQTQDEDKEEEKIEENEDDKKNEDGDNQKISVTTNQEESNNNYLELNHSTAEEAKIDEIKEEEKQNAEEPVIKVEDNKVKELESNNNENQATQQEEEHHQLKEENKEKEKVEVSPSPLPSSSPSLPPSSSQGVMMHGKREAQVSNGVIEETASKLLEARKNRVRALAGAFQSVIDYQSK
nr:nucleolin [Arachis hypogaea]